MELDLVGVLGAILGLALLGLATFGWSFQRDTERTALLSRFLTERGARVALVLAALVLVAGGVARCLGVEMQGRPAPEAVRRLAVGTLVPAAGLFFLWVARTEPAWFMETRRVRALRALLGRTGVRVLYGAGGAALVVLGLLAAIQGTV